MAAAEVTNVRFSNNCPMKKAPVKESCSVTFFYRDCGSSAKNEDRTVSFSAYFVEEMLGYSLEYSNGGGTNTDGCGGTFRAAHGAIIHQPWLHWSRSSKPPASGWLS